MTRGRGLVVFFLPPRVSAVLEGGKNVIVKEALGKER